MPKTHPKSNNGPRSHFSLLPFAVRWRITGMVQDGWTAKAIAGDPEVRQAYESIGAAFNRSSLTRIKRSQEYRQLAEKRAAGRVSAYGDAVSRAVLEENGTLENVAEQTKVVLMEVVKSCIASAGDPKEVERLVRATVSLSDTSKDRKIAELLRKLEEKDRLFQAAEADHAADMARLELALTEARQRIAALESQLPGVESSDVADALSAKFGVTAEEGRP